MSGVKLFIPPHADVRDICRDLGKMRGGLEGMGLKAPCLAEAIDMLTRQSMEIDDWRKGKNKPGDAA